MAEHPKRDHHAPVVVVEPTPEIAGPEGEGAVLKQEHTVTKDCMVTVHGGIFDVKGDEYAWHLKDPDGEVLPLQNMKTSEPSFTPHKLGKYTVTLATTEGRASLIFNVTD